jgi:RNA polymerase sigma-70 factor (ECF subfamily)
MTAGPPDDASLAERALKGDRAAFDAFVRRHQDALYRFIRRYVGDADEAYDLLQESFVSAWQALGRYDRTRPAGAWLRRIALNKCRDWGRRRAVRKFFYTAANIDTAQLASPSVAEGDDDAAMTLLDKAIAELPAQLKEPLLLTAFEGMSQIEAGKALGISPKAVELRIYRARKQLAAAIDAVEERDD